NLAFAIVYNVVGIPLAVAGLLPPWLAGAGMAASSVVVVGNALRARLAQPRDPTAAPAAATAPA
ncbi:MAG TPA: hypothetical protein VM491_20350, partial [Burkholderiaceae bacterium]|nr:hypothetical protein [Burkholderiaceae bacterium]